MAFWNKKPAKRKKVEWKPKQRTPYVYQPKPKPIPSPVPKPAIEEQPKVEVERPLAVIERAVPRPDYEKEFLKIFNSFSNKHRKSEIWSDFVTMFAISMSNAVDKTCYDEREAQYLRTIKKYDEEDQSRMADLAAKTVLALEDNPEQDFLGMIYMQERLGDEGKQQYFTPYHIAHLMAEITTDGLALTVLKEGYATVNDNCCGAGVMLIAAINAAGPKLAKEGYNWQNHMLLFGQDLDYIAAMMCYIQLSLLGAAAIVKVGNSLTSPMCSGDDDPRDMWYTPMYFNDIWTTRRLLKHLKTLEKEKGVFDGKEI